MMSPVVSSLMYSKNRRRVMDVITPRLRELWKEWDLRAMVLLSLTLQVILIILGHRRKYNRKHWIRIILWLAYIVADSVATCALGVLSNNLAYMYIRDGGFLDANIELTALWAPFLLLHLGGPDTITAYALEDNELWLRHLLGLIVQTGVTLYVFIMSWTGSHLSILFIIMFLAGFVKYGERNWVLRSVSNEKLRESMLDYRSSTPANSIFSREQEMKNVEGYHVEVENLVEMKLPVDLTISSSNPISDKDKLIIADGLFHLTKCFFLDVILGSKYKDDSRTVFRNMSSKNAFGVIGIELGFSYDLFYTKTPLLCSLWGLSLRLITFFLIFCVFLVFSFLDHQKHKYSKANLSITFSLLVMAIFLEVYAALALVSSDLFLVWLRRHKKTSTFQILTSIPSFKNHRWSNNMSQLSFLSFSKKEKPLPCPKILKLLNIDEKLGKTWYVTYEKIPEELEELIFCYLRRKACENQQVPSITSGAYREEVIDECPNLKEELGKSILFWHIVTEVLYHLNEENINHQTKENIKHRTDRFLNEENIKHELDQSFIDRCKLTQQISRYMFYLLVLHPHMLSAGMNEVNLRETLKQVKDISWPRYYLSKEEIGLHLLKEEHSFQADQSREGFHSKLSLFPQAMRYAENLYRKSLRETWDDICEGWLEILTYAAIKCKGDQHAQQLRNGGEFLTHVWLLAAHFGLTDHFQISEEYQIARLISK